MAQNEAFASVRVRLEQERASLRSDIKALAADNQAPQDNAGIGNHIADDAADVFARERDGANVTRNLDAFWWIHRHRAEIERRTRPS